MAIKKFNEFKYIKENILEEEIFDEEDRAERWQDTGYNKWKIIVDDEIVFECEYKQDAIEAIIDLLNIDNSNLDFDDVFDILIYSTEIDFYIELEKLKKVVKSEQDIKLELDLTDE